jgi:hypothetical protein
MRPNVENQRRDPIMQFQKIIRIMKAAPPLSPHSRAFRAELLSAAKGLPRWASRCFAAPSFHSRTRLSMTAWSRVLLPADVTLSRSEGSLSLALEMLRGVDTERSEGAQHDSAVLLPRHHHLRAFRFLITPSGRPSHSSRHSPIQHLMGFS